MLSDSKVLVVGTTSDYIDLLRRLGKGGILFLTEPHVRQNALETSPENSEEILSEFTDIKTLLSNLESHLDRYRITLAGITSFDCESLLAASEIAVKYGLKYTSPESVRNCRDKFISKELWKKHNLLTPETRTVSTVDEISRFYSRITGGCVIKPRTGAGSELVFLCKSEHEAVKAFNLINNSLKKKTSRLYDHKNDKQIIAEEYVDAVEYSADFSIRNNKIDIIRITRKIKRPGNVFGITTGYLIINELPDEIQTGYIKKIFLDSCHALDIDNAICMIDFFIKNGKISLLETAPRPGGDCLPFLIEKATGRNIFRTALDFSAGRNLKFNDYSRSEPYLGIRIISEKQGIFKQVDTSAIRNDPLVKEVHILRKTGDKILMPPENYDMWILGHVIVKRDLSITPEEQTNSILEKIKIEVE